MRPSLQALTDRLERLQDIIRLIHHAETGVVETSKRIAVLSNIDFTTKYWDSSIVLFGNLPQDRHILEIKTKALAYWVRRYNREIAALGLPQVITNHLKQPL